LSELCFAGACQPGKDDEPLRQECGDETPDELLVAPQIRTDKVLVTRPDD
jgi:hypothetical protein